jgi:hypothetical protein
LPIELPVSTTLRRLTVAEMAKMHDGRRGGVSARLVRLGLIEPDTPEREIGRPDRPCAAVPVSRS